MTEYNLIYVLQADRETLYEKAKEIAKQMIEQGRPSLNDEDGCMYRAPNGNKCAVGCEIDDKEYDLAMEGMDIHGLVGKNLFPKSLVPFFDVLEAAQELHDSYYEWNTDPGSHSDWETDWEKFPEEWAE